MDPILESFLPVCKISRYASSGQIKDKKNIKTEARLHFDFQMLTNSGYNLSIGQT